MNQRERNRSHLLYEQFINDFNYFFLFLKFFYFHVFNKFILKKKIRAYRIIIIYNINNVNYDEI